MVLIAGLWKILQKRANIFVPIGQVAAVSLRPAFIALKLGIKYLGCNNKYNPHARVDSGRGECTCHLFPFPCLLCFYSYLTRLYFTCCLLCSTSLHWQLSELCFIHSPCLLPNLLYIPQFPSSGGSHARFHSTYYTNCSILLLTSEISVSKLQRYVYLPFHNCLTFYTIS